MTTILYTHDDCDGHVTPQGHPERVERLGAIRAALAGFDALDRREAPLGTPADVLRCHPEDREAYEALKRRLASDADEHTAEGRFGYSEAKTEFIRAIERRTRLGGGAGGPVASTRDRAAKEEGSP